LNKGPGSVIFFVPANQILTAGGYIFLSVNPQNKRTSPSSVDARLPFGLLFSKLLLLFCRLPEGACR
jgi:hypothetical protein